MKISSKNQNSITPLFIETNDGKKFEISGELIKGGYSAYKDSLVLIVQGNQIELNEIGRDKYTIQILEELKKKMLQQNLKFHKSCYIVRNFF